MTTLQQRHDALRQAREVALDRKARAEQARETAETALAEVLSAAGCTTIDELRERALRLNQEAEAALTAAEQAFAQ